MEKIVSPTKARAHLYALITAANRDSHPILIAGSEDNKSAVLMSKRDYDAQQETMALLMNGQLQDAMSREGQDAVDLSDMIDEIEHEK